MRRGKPAATVLGLIVKQSDVTLCFISDCFSQISYIASCKFDVGRLVLINVKSFKYLNILTKYLCIIKKLEPKPVPPAARAVQVLGFYV
ncbi:hypothetical protein APA_4878 [Pseudanabaena sp. lw0831]|nr:hypothetical protein APA_4878 [Pseudanabaena sp. lw0831]